MWGTILERNSPSALTFPLGAGDIEVRSKAELSLLSSAGFRLPKVGGYRCSFTPSGYPGFLPVAV